MICDEESETVREPLLIYGEESVDCKVYASTTYDFASDVTSYTRSHMASPQANVIINDEKRGRGPGPQTVVKEALNHEASVVRQI